MSEYTKWKESYRYKTNTYPSGKEIWVAALKWILNYYHKHGTIIDPIQQELEEVENE